MSVIDNAKGTINVGQKLLSSNALTKYSILPGVAGGVGGLGYGAYEKTTNPYAIDSLGDYALKGSLVGVGMGGVAVSSGRVLRDYRIYKQSKFTNSTSTNSKYGLSSFGDMLASANG